MGTNVNKSFMSGEAERIANSLESRAGETPDGERDKALAMNLRATALLLEQEYITLREMESRLHLFRKECPVHTEWVNRDRALKELGWGGGRMYTSWLDRLILIGVLLYILAKMEGWL